VISALQTASAAHFAASTLLFDSGVIALAGPNADAFADVAIVSKHDSQNAALLSSLDIASLPQVPQVVFVHGCIPAFAPANTTSAGEAAAALSGAFVLRGTKAVGFFIRQKYPSSLPKALLTSITTPARLRELQIEAIQRGDPADTWAPLSMFIA